MSDTRPDVTDNPSEQRYEAVLDGRLAGIVAYAVRDDAVLELTHTEVDDAFEGRGVGSALVRDVLDDVRRRGLTVVPSCPFVAAWIERHPDHADLVHRA